MTTLLTIGTFDTPHVGHAAFLRRCERFADEVRVGVNSDAFVERYKGNVPVFDQGERMRLVSRLGYPVHLNDGPGRDLILSVRPDVLAIAADWATRDYYGQINFTQRELDGMNCVLAYIPYTPGISTTLLRERLGMEDDLK